MMEVKNSLLKTLNKQYSERTPIWLMRQAGRYLPEYREIRKNFNNFLEFCFNPLAATEVTLQPLNRFDLDAAIIFSDILTIPHALGVEVNFIKGEGPHVEVVDTKQKIKNLELTKLKDLEKVYEAIKLTKSEIEKSYPGKALIGFAGSPWTVACYMIQGKSDQKFQKVINFSIENPLLFRELLDKITHSTIFHLKQQIIHGADVIKLFDSWAGLIFGDQYKKWVIEPTKVIVGEIKKDFPEIKIIGFPRNSGKLYKKYAEETGVDCISVSDDVSMKWAVDNIKEKTLQGNFNNIILATSKEEIKKEVGSILKYTHNHAYIFNLNHGILPDTPIENVKMLIESIRNFIYEGNN